MAKNYKEFSNLNENNNTNIDFEELKSWIDTNDFLLNQEDENELSFDIEDYSGSATVKSDGSVEIHTTYNDPFKAKIEKVSDMYKVISDYEEWYQNQDDDQ